MKSVSRFLKNTQPAIKRLVIKACKSTAVIGLCGLAPALYAEPLNTSQKMAFIFDCEKKIAHKANNICVKSNQMFSAKSGFGADLGTRANTRKPFYFSVRLPEGNYRVTAVLGSASSNTHIGIKAESRRLFLPLTSMAKNQFLTTDFIVNTRTPRLTPPEKNAPGGGKVFIKAGEQQGFNWDDKLTLEFLGDAPYVKEIHIEAVDVPVIYLMGDSTVTDQEHEPAASWGQMLPVFFNNKIAVANHAESGETLKSFISSLRFAKIIESVKEGDYVLIQFGHNDQKKNWPQTYVEANTTYKDYLRTVASEITLRGATPVLVTSMQRRNFDESGKVINTHGDYPNAVRDLARELTINLVDLEKISHVLYPALEPHSHTAFNENGKDRTHHNNYGAYLFAAAVASELSKVKSPIAQWLKKDFLPLDPHNPLGEETLKIPVSMKQSNVRPDGN
jgi:lysophospholipase L1-like esterase